MSEAEAARPVVLEARALTKDYGRRRAVDTLDLRVHAGHVYGFLGPNGAGKSTTIRMLLGLIRPTEGEAYVLGESIRRRRVQALRHVGAQVETPAFYGYLSGLRNLRMLASLSGRVTPDDLDEVLERVKLRGREHDKVRTYSQGMRMRLGLAQALLPRPQLLVLDEPTNGLDPQGMKEVRDLVRSLAHDEGITVFLSSHLLGEVQQVCDRVAVIDRGRLVAEGDVATLLADAAAGQARVGCDRVDEAAAVAGGVEGVTAVRTLEDGLEVDLDPNRAADLNAALVAAGIRVHELTPVRRSLEEFFLAITGGTRP
ncbi:MAG: ABC transporter ATP-binding protein [Armatimonadetes bacterium]|nr:ABC transporter ATP-binding protein [Armatimonadota bacterium]